MAIERPHIIQFDRIGEPAIGYISVAESSRLPFKVERLYWTYFTPESVKRGYHAHYELEQIIIAVAGQITVITETPEGDRETFRLSKPDAGLFIPKLCWREMQYSHNAVQVVMASKEYDEKDYIRDYSLFKTIRGHS